ncbi:MAG: Hint domain-containing protein, partial [Rhodobacteraceae bacterium]|nr:Hint domain-containing protein [Paracoccaceae bacterium]
IDASPMTRITADAFGGSRPMPDLLLGPQARLLMKNARTRAAGHTAAYLPARSLIDGDTIIEVNTTAPMTMFHIVLEHQGSLSCAGVAVESFHPGKKITEKLDPQLAALLLALFPQMNCFADFGPMAHARLTLEEADDLAAA